MPAGAVIIKDQFAEHVLDMAVFPTRPPFTNVDGYGIICAVQTAKPFTAAIWRQTLQSSGLRMLHHSQNRLCRFHCRFAAGKPEWACCCGIITAKRLLYRAMPNGSPLARQPPFDGQLYHAASRTWYNNRRAVIIHLMARAIRGRGPLPPRWPMIPYRFADMVSYARGKLPCR